MAGEPASCWFYHIKATPLETWAIMITIMLISVIVFYLQQLGRWCITMSVGKQLSLEDFTKSQSGINVPDVARNLVPDVWTADGEGMLPEIGLWTVMQIVFHAEELELKWFDQLNRKQR